MRLGRTMCHNADDHGSTVMPVGDYLHSATHCHWWLDEKFCLLVTIWHLHSTTSTHCNWWLDEKCCLLVTTLSQKQFLGSKHFKILHENVRDIALKMYRLWISRYIITNSYTYNEVFRGSFFAKVSRDISRYRCFVVWRGGRLSISRHFEI